MFVKKNDEAVSPVIGVILMVAITVILAAVIAAFVFGMAGNLDNGNIVMVKADRINESTVQITMIGGTGLSDLESVDISGDVSGSIGLSVGDKTEFFVPNRTQVNVVAIGRFSGDKQRILLNTYV